MEPLAFVCLAIALLTAGVMTALFLRERRGASSGRGNGDVRAARDSVADYTDRRDEGPGGSHAGL